MAAWLLICCALVFLMVVVGGITRLTHSGLSMVEWQPIVGTIPPLDEAQWQEVFQKYQQTPEVAGIRAGLAYNTFPLMNGNIVPPEYLLLEPWWRNLFNSMAAVQFNHRLIAWLLFLLIPLFWLASRRLELRPSARLACNALPVVLAVQIALAISTLLFVVPVPLAAAHQAGAMLLFAAALWVSHELR